MSQLAGPRSRRPLSRLLVAALLAGVTAGAATGAIDALWSWRSLSQFLPDAGAKMRLVVYLASSYAVAAAAAGVAVALVASFFLHATRLGDLIRYLQRAQRQARRRDPRDAVIPLALVVAAIPSIAVSLGLAYGWAVGVLAPRRHIGLVIAAAMATALGAFAVSSLVSFAIARPIELGLRLLAARPRAGRVLASSRTALVAAVVLGAAAAAVAALLSWKTLSLLHLRPQIIIVAGALLAVPSFGLGDRISLCRAGAQLHRLGIAATLLALVASMLAAGGSEAIRKAAAHYSGLGGPLTNLFRRACDFDRDGHSPILGGGDCHDLDGDVHPGAMEIPDDGIDQNCLGGDAKLAPPPTALRFSPLPPGIPPAPNVLLVTIDTLRADHVGAYGYPRATSPELDRVAAQGTVFVNAWAHAPSTRYSMPAILTGRYPLNVDYDDSIVGWPGLRDTNTTIAELLKSRGFATGAILNHWYFDRYRRIDQGFDHYDNDNKILHQAVPGRGPAHSRGSSSRQQTDKALAFVTQKKDERFFLWVHYYDPHYEYEAHAEVPSFGGRAIDLYDHEIRFTDYHVGRLLAGLRALGLYDRTVIVITGDHGEGFGEHGIILHGYHLYAAQTKVPLIIRVPGLSPGKVTTPVGHIDILPTLAHLAGAPRTAEMMGESLLDRISGAAPAHQDRYVFQQLSYENNNEKRGAASQRCHVVYNVSPHPSWELYRIDIDPLEQRDVSGEPGVCAPARRELETWYDRSQIPAAATAALLPRDPGIEHPLDVYFGGEIRLLAVDLPAAPVLPGSSFEITYTFAAKGRLRGGWKVFAHFEGPGHARFLADHTPARPFAWWRAGQFIRYAVSASVPAAALPGEYALWTGVFRGNKRRPARSQGIPIEADRARVGSIGVARPTREATAQ